MTNAEQLGGDSGRIDGLIILRGANLRPAFVGIPKALFFLRVDDV